jgi:hypothetical protein
LAFDGVPIMGQPLGDAARHLADINFFLADLETIAHFRCVWAGASFGTGSPRNLPNGTALPFS